ncbi:MAG TPA: hypothetical protein VIH42_13830 [Thermoguttaceae bacterium]
MWCRHCQQDVPALGTSGERKYCCPRCGETLDAQCPSQTDDKTFLSDSPPACARAEEISSFEDWELDDQLRHIGRVLQIDSCRDGHNEKVYHREVARIDPAHDMVDSYHVSPTLSALLGHKPKPHRTSSGVSILGFLTWITFSLGTMALICGGILLGWSVIAGRDELWKFGLPIAAGGQVALLIGLVFKLDRLWNDNRHAVAKLDEEIHDLKTTTSLLGTAHGPSSMTFYTHLAGGANPQLLLSDLKSQLDLLAMKISEKE